ncbi:MAG: hypothetical protein NZM37_08325, partial [Sandaracinaceae bacterium]|nr:hypothetical protein [Sandaracinaceae bacterium]MDW8246308.1 hypothetical protein [Sandaracinaceae bacterium]
QVRVEAPTARIVAIDGRLPSPEGVRDGTYPFFKELSFVALEPIDELAVRFIEFSRSEKGRQIIVSMGALPWPFDHPSNHLDRKQP